MSHNLLSLRSLAKGADWWLDGPILNPLRRLGGSMIVTAGPWVLAIVTLVLIGKTAQARLSAAALEDMRLTVIYAFMIASVVAAPLGVSVARTITQAAMPRPPAELGALMLVACGMAGVTAQVVAVGVSYVLGLAEPAVILAFVVLTSASAMTWTAFAVLGACRAQRRLILAFSLGMSGALVLSVLVVNHATGAADMVWCFTAGIVFSFALCLTPFEATKIEGALLYRAAKVLRNGAMTTSPLALGAGLAVAGIWADKWVVWAGPTGQISTAGFRHQQTYDGAMFFAQLSAIPALAAVALFFEIPVHKAMAGFRVTIANGASFDSVRQIGEAVSTLVWTGLLRIMSAQLALSVALVLAATTIATAAGLRLDQFLILRTGIMGVFLHTLFLAASGILVVCNHKWAFLKVQALFLVANIVFSSTLVEALGVSAAGFALAAASCAIVANVLAFMTIRKIIVYYFLTGNDSLFSKPSR